MSDEDAARNATRILNNALREFFPRQSKYRFFSDKKGNRYFWTPGKTTHPDKPGRQCYVSGVYRYLKTKKVYVLRQAAGHGKRFKAKERALRLLNKEGGR